MSNGRRDGSGRRSDDMRLIEMAGAIATLKSKFNLLIVLTTVLIAALLGPAIFSKNSERLIAAEGFVKSQQQTNKEIKDDIKDLQNNLRTIGDCVQEIKGMLEEHNRKHSSGGN